MDKNIGECDRQEETRGKACQQAAKKNDDCADEQSHQRFKKKTRRAGQDGQQETHPGRHQRRDQNSEQKNGLRVEQESKSQDRAADQ